MFEIKPRKPGGSLKKQVITVMMIAMMKAILACLPEKGREKQIMHHK
jgi:hypothetical protein